MSVQIHGFCDARFAPLKEAFAANFEAGLELGASLGVTYRGQSVVDLWAGFANPKRTRAWEENTIVQVASTTKIMASLALLMQVDRGLIELDAPVARYWPEFAQGGKQAVTVRDVFTHRAGVPGLDPPAPFALGEDWRAMAARIAAEPHWFGGERRVVYHNRTYGYLCGELIRRVDGRTPRQFCDEEIARPRQADFVIGIRTETGFARLAAPLMPATPFEPPDEMLSRVLNSIEPAPDLRSGLARDDPGALGFSNGRGIARVCAILANGGALDGVRYLSPALTAAVGQEQCDEDIPMFGRVRFGLGFALHSPQYKLPAPSYYHWGGAGGSVGFIDPASRISLGYAPNNMEMTGGGPGHVETRQQRFIDALRRVHEIL